MKFELLLLFGSFCTITHASTLVVPTEVELEQVTGAFVPTAATEAEKEAPENVVTEAMAPAATEATVEETDAPSAPTEVPVMITEAPSSHTEATVKKTEGPLTHTVAPEEETGTPTERNGVTEATTEISEGNVPVKDTTTTENTLVDETAGNTEASEAEQTNKTDEPVLATERDELEMVDHDVMSAGHVVGIVFAALVAVAIIIAVIVVVVRRMGQYSTGKKRMPEKRDGLFLSPLKRKAMRQEGMKKKKKKKFWKF